MSTELPTFISPDHRDRLAWFDKHKGEILPMSGLQEDTMLAFKPKGIYKPAGWEYSLSIRINRNSPYDDGGVQWLPDGGRRLRRLAAPRGTPALPHQSRLMTLYARRTLSRVFCPGLMVTGRADHIQ